MLIGAAILKNPPPLLALGGAPIDNVVTFKLLGVHVAGELVSRCLMFYLVTGSDETSSSV